MIATASTPLRPSIGYLHCRAAARHAAKICENLRNLRIENAFFAPSRLRVRKKADPAPYSGISSGLPLRGCASAQKRVSKSSASAELSMTAFGSRLWRSSPSFMASRRSEY